MLLLSTPITRPKPLNRESRQATWKRFNPFVDGLFKNAVQVVHENSLTFSSEVGEVFGTLSMQSCCQPRSRRMSEDGGKMFLMDQASRNESNDASCCYHWTDYCWRNDSACCYRGLQGNWTPARRNVKLCTEIATNSNNSVEKCNAMTEKKMERTHNTSMIVERHATTMTAFPATYMLFAFFVIVSIAVVWCDGCCGTSGFHGIVARKGFTAKSVVARFFGKPLMLLFLICVACVDR
jgi:hypothetical protein